MDYGIDTNRTFEMKDLLIFTDNLEVKTNLFLWKHQLFLSRFCKILFFFVFRTICLAKDFQFKFVLLILFALSHVWDGF